MAKKKYKVKELPGYQIIKILGDDTKDQADIIRDLIVAAVEPPMSREEVEALPLKEFLELAKEVSEKLNLKEADLKKFQS